MHFPAIKMHGVCVERVPYLPPYLVYTYVERNGFSIACMLQWHRCRITDSRWRYGMIDGAPGRTWGPFCCIPETINTGILSRPIVVYSQVRSAAAPRESAAFRFGDIFIDMTGCNQLGNGLIFGGVLSIGRL